MMRFEEIISGRILKDYSGGYTRRDFENNLWWTLKQDRNKAWSILGYVPYGQLAGLAALYETLTEEPHNCEGADCGSGCMNVTGTRCGWCCVGH